MARPKKTEETHTEPELLFADRKPRHTPEEIERFILHLEDCAARIAAGYAQTSMPEDEIAEKSVKVAIGITDQSRKHIMAMAAAHVEEPEPEPVA